MPKDVELPPTSDFDGWNATEWKGAPQPPFFVIHFVHPARVRLGENREPEAEWFDNDPRSTWPRKNQWHRIVQPQLARRLYEQIYP